MGLWGQRIQTKKTPIWELPGASALRKQKKASEKHQGRSTSQNSQSKNLVLLFWRFFILGLTIWHLLGNIYIFFLGFLSKSKRNDAEFIGFTTTLAFTKTFGRSKKFFHVKEETVYRNLTNISKKFSKNLVIFKERTTNYQPSKNMFFSSKSLEENSWGLPLTLVRGWQLPHLSEAEAQGLLIGEAAAGGGLEER